MATHKLMESPSVLAGKEGGPPNFSSKSRKASRSFTHGALTLFKVAIAFCLAAKAFLACVLKVST